MNEWFSVYDEARDEGPPELGEVFVLTVVRSWISASRVLGTPRPETESEGGTPAGGEVRPTA
jgi:hypothetical protein